MKFKNCDFWLRYNSKENLTRWDRAKDINLYLKENYDLLSSDERKCLIWEKNITDLQPSSSKGSRFGPMFELGNEAGEKTIYPDISKDFTGDSFEYYKTRAEKINNPILLARYFDVLVTLKKDYQFAIKAMDAYLETLDLYLQRKWDSELIDSLLRICEIAVITKNETYQAMVIEKYVEVIDTLNNLSRPRYILELIDDIVSRFKIFYKHIDIIHFVARLDRAIEFYRSNENENSHLERSFLEAKIGLYQSLKKNEEVLEIQRQIFASHVKDAETMIMEPMVARQSYDLALNCLNLIGASVEEKDKVRLKIQELSEKAPESFKTIESSIEIPKEIVEQAKEEFLKCYNGKSIEDKIIILSIDNRLIVSYDHYLESSKKSTSQSLFGHINQEIYSSGFVVKKTNSLEENIEHWANLYLFMTFDTLIDLHLNPLFDEMAKEDNFLIELEKFISENGLFDKSKKAIFLRAVENHLRCDYISPLHILPFTIEGFLRDLLKGLGVPILKFENGVGSVKGLKPLLDIFEQVSGINKNFCHIIRFLLVTDGYKNLRDRAAHSLLDVEDCNKLYSMQLIWICIKLAGLRVEKS